MSLAVVALTKPGVPLSAFLVAALLATVLPHITADVDFKCTQPAPRQTVYLVDGDFVAVQPGEHLVDVTAGEIEAMEILCMNPKDSTFTAGIGIPVVAVWTKQGPVAQMKPTLAAILDAQDRYAEQHSAYARSVAELSLPRYPDKFDIDLDVDAEHWRATIRMYGYLGTCYVYDGAHAASSAAAAPRAPDCVYNRAVPAESSGAGGASPIS